jgi:micrococcal nuclease
LINRIIILAAVLIAVGTPTHSIDLCSGGNRAARKVTCLVDGDTGWENGVKWRLLDIDTPETSQAECAAEQAIGKRATIRLQQLMSAGYTLESSGRTDRTSDHRELLRVRLVDGRDAGSVLVDEGLAQRWPNKRNIWCGP